MFVVVLKCSNQKECIALFAEPQTKRRVKLPGPLPICLPKSNEFFLLTRGQKFLKNIFALYALPHTSTSVWVDLDIAVNQWLEPNLGNVIKCHLNGRSGLYPCAALEYMLREWLNWKLRPFRGSLLFFTAYISQLFLWGFICLFVLMRQSSLTLKELSVWCDFVRESGSIHSHTKHESSVSLDTEVF